MLQGILQGKGDIDGLVVALAALFAHHYGTALAKLLAFVREQRRYVVPLFVVALVRHVSVQTYVVQNTAGAPNTVRRKMRAFVAAMHDEVEHLLTNQLTVDDFARVAREMWVIS